VLLAALVAVSATPVAHAQEGGPTEYEVKAAFLYNFAKFIAWPEGTFQSENEVFTLCVLGEDPFGETLDRAVADKTVHGRRLSVRRFRDLDAIEGCHILFVSTSENDQLGAVLSKVGETATLTVGKVDEFLERGGIIRLMLIDNKVRFAVNTYAANRAKLEISSQLLKLATEVVGKQ
jgi:hypothetical protein